MTNEENLLNTLVQIKVTAVDVSNIGVGQSGRSPSFNRRSVGFQLDTFYRNYVN